MNIADAWEGGKVCLAMKFILNKKTIPMDIKEWFLIFFGYLKPML
jgi:hypothetical protein